MGPTETQFINEEEFLPQLNHRVQEFFRLLNLLCKKTPSKWQKRHYSVLAEEAHELESYLDDFQARYNRKFSYLTELFASIKWFGYAGSLQKHILMRFPNYTLGSTPEMKIEFNFESQKTLEYLNQSILVLIDHLHKEAAKLPLDLPVEVPQDLNANHSGLRKILPQNIDEDDIVDQRHIIAELATLYKNLTSKFRKIKIRREADLESVKNQTLYEFDETRTRQFESQIHNIQSKYDTYLKNTVVESKNSCLSHLRGYTSIALHLFEMATILVHFYERHEDDIRYERIKEKSGAIIPKQDLLRILNDYLRYFGIQFILEGERYADEIINAFIQIREIKIDTLGTFALHARPLSLIAKVALQYNTPLEITIEGNSCNANSIMQMILLAGNNPNPQEIIFKGEERALKDIRDLFDHVLLPKQGLDDVPPQLGYLAQ